MLIQLVIENFLSFKDKVVLNLTASSNGTGHDDRVRRTTRDGAKLLNCAALYGANASGKSNLVRAVSFARELILKGTQLEDTIGVKAFKLDPEWRGEPSRFEFEIDYLGRQYVYGFIVTATDVKAEWLFIRDEAGERQVFDRAPVESDPAAPSRIELGDAIPAERRGFLGYVAEGTRREQLFLTEAALKNVEEVRPLIEWFKDRLVIIDPQSHFVPWLPQRVEKEPALKEFLSELMARAGTGVEGVSTSSEERQELNDFGQITPGTRFESLVTTSVRMMLREKVESETKPSAIEQLRVQLKDTYLRLTTQHRDSQGNLIDFELDEESDGTQRLLNLAPLLYDVEHSPERRQTVYLIDELDRSLHPLLTRLYLKSFLEIDPENNHGQLIFTTHDTNLLNLDLLRADEIWFVEKNREGASSLYSLAEFKPEQLEQLGSDLERGYLNGRFGAIPFFGDITRLGWKNS